MAISPQEAALIVRPRETTPGPSVIPGRAAGVPLSNRAAKGVGLSNAFAAFDQISDPRLQAMALAVVRNDLPELRGVPITESEVRSFQQQTRVETNNRERSLLKDRYTRIVADLVDSANATVPGDSQGRTLQEYMNAKGVPGPIDQSLFDDPERLVDAANLMANDDNIFTSDIEGFQNRRDAFALTSGQLIRAGLPSAMESVRERAAAGVADQVSENEQAQKLLEQNARDPGQTPAGIALEAIEEQAEAAGGVDISPGFNSNIDTPAGSEALLSRFNEFTAVAGSKLGLQGSTIVDAFIAEHGADITDQLEELPTQEVAFKDPKTGKAGVATLVDSTASTFDVEAEAADKLTQLVARMASVAQVSPAQLYARLGLPFTDTQKGFSDAVLTSRDQK